MKEQSIADNRYITERIKTFDDALVYLEYRAKELKDRKAKVLVDDWNYSLMNAPSVYACTQLLIITYALNEGWQPEFKEGEDWWSPYYFFWEAADIDKMDEEYKDKVGLLLWKDGNGEICGMSFDCSDLTGVGGESPFLVFRNVLLADYAGRQFATLYACYLLGDKGLTAKPWREFEK